MHVCSQNIYIHMIHLHIHTYTLAEKHSCMDIYVYIFRIQSCGSGDPTWVGTIVISNSVYRIHELILSVVL